MDGAGPTLPDTSERQVENMDVKQNGNSIEFYNGGRLMITAHGTDAVNTICAARGMTREQVRLSMTPTPPDPMSPAGSGLLPPPEAPNTPEVSLSLD